MKKNIYLLFIIFLCFDSAAQVIDCPDRNQKDYNCGNIEENILATIDRKGYTMNSHFTVSLSSTFSKDSDNRRGAEVTDLCNKVLNDPDFWNALEHYRGYRYAVFENAQGKREITGAQIINSLINGNPNDSSRPSKVNIMLNIELYGMSIKTPFESAVAKEIGDGKIYNKKWFFRKSSIADIGSNWLHEFSHSKGVSHCYYCHQERDYSIPYVINRIFVEVAQKYLTDRA
ncbi:MAG: hypothetical protein ABW007_22105 [Chitinophagaceae bacterium]